MKRSAFTMIELIFVIVILGILAAVAIPKLAGVQDDAIAANEKAVIGATRSSVQALRGKTIARGGRDFNLSVSSIDGLVGYVTVSQVNGVIDTVGDVPVSGARFPMHLSLGAAVTAGNDATSDRTAAESVNDETQGLALGIVVEPGELHKYSTAASAAGDANSTDITGPASSPTVGNDAGSDADIKTGDLWTYNPAAGTILFVPAP